MGFETWEQKHTSVDFLPLQKLDRSAAAYLAAGQRRPLPRQNDLTNMLPAFRRAGRGSLDTQSSTPVLPLYLNQPQTGSSKIVRALANRVSCIMYSLGTDPSSGAAEIEFRPMCHPRATLFAQWGAIVVNAS